MEYSEKKFKQLAERVFEDGGIDPDNLPEDLYFAIAEYLKKGVYEGFGGTLADFDGKPARLLTELRENIYIFSAAKTYQQCRALTDALTNEEGVKRSFSEFYREALEIDSQYNKNWARTEFDTAFGQAQQSRQWVEIEANKDALPMLRYSAILDANTSDICRPLDGIIAPVNDPIWNTVAPLNHFNCRCTLEQLPDSYAPTNGYEKKAKEVQDEMQPLFKMNCGKDGYVFKKDHPYFEVAPKDRKLAANNFNLPIPNED